ncbi:MAG TPA: hypothetical protein VHZ24_11655 [Pirellulales bacterium]|jgi:hypothetical protein|nr:hypothetical protein [Pirellulales bacterium]
MGNKVMRIVIACVAIVVGAASLYRYYENRVANRLVHEGNAAMEVGNDFNKQAVAKHTELFSEASLREFPANRAKLKPTVEETADLFHKTAEQYRITIAKFDEAGKEDVDSEVVEYWKLKVQSTQKLAESKDELRKLVLMLLDESIADAQALDTQMKPVVANIVALSNESEALTQQAEKLRTEHKSKFE